MLISANSNSADRPEWLNKAIADASNNPQYAYTYKFDDGEQFGVIRVDLSLPEGERITILEPSEESVSEKFRNLVKSMNMEITKESLWCIVALEEIPESIGLISETSQLQVFSTAYPGAKELEVDTEFKVLKKDMSILSIRQWNAKPFKPEFYAKINKIELDVSCAQSDDGRSYAATVNLHLQAKVMLKTIEKMVSASIYDLRNYRVVIQSAT